MGRGDQPPFTPEQARALSKRPPKPSGYSAGSSRRGEPGNANQAAKNVRRPGPGDRKGPNEGRNN